MKHVHSTFWLFFIIVFEGYIVLSTELLAIRQSFPYAGSGTETVSIIIAAVLMPLAVGYYTGGRFKPRPGFGVRDKLIRNIIISMVILVPALSYLAIGDMYRFLIINEVKHRLVHISLYSAIFIVTPVYLLGQTVPLISNYFGKERLARITGRILFFSTLGSFLGAIVTTLILMATIGVNNTVALNFVIMAVLVLVLSKKKLSRWPVVAAIIACFAVFLNSNALEYSMGAVIEHNQYNTIVVRKRGDGNHLFLNNSASSKYDANYGNKYTYIEVAENLALDPILLDEEPRDILIIGAGAFTFGYEDDFHNYHFVDIDKNLKRIAEEHILPEPLSENKKFFSMPARAYLKQTDKKYDVILLDTYFGRITMPEHLLTVEFFEQIRDHMKEDAVLITNFAIGPNFLDSFSRNLDNTMRVVFPYVSRHVLRDQYKPWNNDPEALGNVLYIYRHLPDFGEPSIYTDNKNRAFLDKP